MVCIMPFLIFSSLHAQQGTEWKTQGNTADTNSFIGTTNASSLILRSNDVERMRINENGNVGIGVNEPNEKLHVSGTVRIDSVLYARDSLVVGESGYIQGDLEVKGNITIRQGALRVKSLIDTSLSRNGVLKVNEEGEIINGGDLKYNVYKEIEETYHCAKDVEGGIIYEAAYWQNDPQRIFILNSRCKPDVKLGVGVKPEAKFHIRTNNNSQVHPLVIEKLSNQSTYRLLQLNNDGLLRAREIKVDLEAWPDYVFEKDYNLMPIDQLRTFINNNGHLPNVPSAKEIETDGINLGDAAKTSMEKIEELTLYLLEINDKVENQEEVLNEQSKLLEQQNETIRLQQELI